MAVPLLLRWQGVLHTHAAVESRLAWLAGSLLTLLLAGLPLFTRSGLTLLIAATGALWLLWSLVTPPDRIRPIGGWLLLFLGIAVLATGFSPVPAAAAKGLVKLLGYLGVYALASKLLLSSNRWWDRLLAGLL